MNFDSWLSKGVARPILDLADLTESQLARYNPADLERSEVDRPLTIEDVDRARESLEMVAKWLQSPNLEGPGIPESSSAGGEI